MPKTTKGEKMKDNWIERLKNLKAVNYNIYFGVDGGDNAITFDEAVDELKQFIQTEINLAVKKAVADTEKRVKEEIGREELKKLIDKAYEHLKNNK